MIYNNNKNVATVS